MRIDNIREWIKVILIALWIGFLHPVLAQTDTLSLPTGSIHRVEIDVRPSYIFPTNTFLAGNNEKREPINDAFSAHLKYSFQAKPNSIIDQIYKGSYQGIGLGYFDLGESKLLGNPISFYLFQGARIAQISPRLSLNYEWNLGLSFNWNPYDEMDNPYNIIIGSRINAYINANVYLKWMLSRQVDMVFGASISHFSNGNTKFPNAGLNTTGVKIGLIYNFNREDNALQQPLFTAPVPLFPRHVSYDVMLFGSWRRKGVQCGDGQIASPHKYTVLGFNFTPLYNFSYRFRAGLSLDGVYDKSANMSMLDYDSNGEPTFYSPPLDWQLALGVSARAEYVMPYFTIGIGLGANAISRGRDFKAVYQMAYLKTEITKSTYLHIGYSLNDFHDPNYLMLGIGYRFNNKSLYFHR